MLNNFSAVRIFLHEMYSNYSVKNCEKSAQVKVLLIKVLGEKI